MKKFICIMLVVMFLFVGCESVPTTGTSADVKATIASADKLQEKQPTPSDIDYSIPRWLLIRRAYFTTGQREKARTLPCEIADVPLAYIVLFTESGSVVGKFIVEGMVMSLNSYLTPDSEVYEMGEYMNDGVSHYDNKWLADVDGTYGENDNGIFFFTPDGKYLEWTGIYLYSDIPFEINDPVLKVSE